MTKKERFMTILKKGKADTITWAPNFDHWFNVNHENGTLPDEYKDMSRNDIARAVDVTIWSRTSMLKQHQPNVRIKSESIPGKYIRTVYETPVGSVETLHQYASDSTRALFLKEHMIKSVEDIKVVKFMIEDIQYSLDTRDFIKSEQDVGDDGISLVSLPFCMPYIQFGKVDAGWERGIYLYYDYPEEVEALLEAYAQKIEEAAGLLAQSPAIVINCNDNMDEWTTPPDIFKRYAIPFYERISKILHEHGKILQVHWCGRTKNLLPLIQDCGIDVVEAVTVEPMDRITIPEVLEKVGENVVIQGGIPSIMMCPQGATREELEEYVRDLLNKVPLGYRFVLGMSDNVPPDADFYRVKMISDIVNSI